MLERFKRNQGNFSIIKWKTHPEFICILVRQVMEYSSLSWKTTSSNDLHPLETVKKAFALCLGKPGIASREDIKVASGVTENLVREIEKRKQN